MPGIGVLLYVGLVAVLPALCHPHTPCTLTQRTAICNSLRLSSVPGNLPQQIEELFLNENIIIKLQNGCFSRYPFLRTLSCANCLLNASDDQVFSSSPLIESLGFASNELHKEHKQFAQSLGSLSRLRILDISGNGLTEDMVSELLENLTSLEFLDLSRNVLLRLDEYAFRNLHQLKELNLERNVLFEIDGAFDHLKKLRRINLAFNSLPCLMKFEMTQLIVLNASHNLIEWFITNQDLTETFELETLDLSDNRLLYFPFLPTYNRIKTLLLANNHIGFYSHLSQITSLNWTNSVEFYNLGGNASNITAELWSDDFHGDISSVELLDLSVNQVRYFPQGFLRKMPRLYWLRMRSNCFESLNLTGEDLPVTLYELDVSNNRLTELHAHSSVSELNNLTHLNLSLNNIQKLPPRVFTTFPSLSIVDLSYNTVGLCHPKELHNSNSSACALWTNLSSLKQLHIAGCNLINIPPLVFDGTPLTYLDLSNNPDLHIGQDCLSGLSGTLQHLGLSNTGLQDFNFSPFKQLKFLNISKNSISELPKSLMTLNLKLLDLRNNRLSTIKPEHATVLAKQVQIVYINGNYFNCCQLDWYRTFEESKILHVADLLEVTCVDLHQQILKAGLFDSVLCGGKSTDESIFWYILLFLSIGVSLVGVSVIYFLTFRPRLLPRVIKKKCWKPTTY
ncbi:transforming growth factor beta activator LRRC33 [Ictalurus furcatus]|uniref:transforming growth factor beta activator LRRC33 n=1 Tax=Ictalurus furcatus TaxID=66913 RepID=UPI00234FC7DF|nr:transforming growth factor beta activator LRRC33 [Ictalurus furcatus]XP_053477930.1 transforming growth factor beta activator LRRC33 [Ictalurus furcatus]